MTDLPHLPPVSRRPVVVGVDGSSHAFHALVWAADEARERGVPLHVVHAWSVPTTVVSAAPVPTTFIDPTVFEADALALVTEVAASLRARLGRSCPDVEASIAHGDPVGVLARAAATAGLLVVGTHGRGAIANAVLGSVAEGCLRIADTPVAVVPATGLAAAADAPVVVGVDDSDAARAALEWAALEAGRLGRRLVVVHAHDVESAIRPDLDVLPEATPSTMARSGRGFLDHLLAKVAVIGGRPRSVAWRVVVGDPTDVLVASAAGAAMLVIGVPHPHGLRERLFGSTGRRCVREATCPVVVVPLAGVEPVTDLVGAGIDLTAAGVPTTEVMECAS